ncbi:MAG: CPXCG motif-containing cysteine-rich protein [bacterium]
MQDTFQINCPYCGQPNEIFIDFSGGPVQNYQEECQVCCQSCEIHVEIVDDQPAVTVCQSNE